jgi:cobalt-zinc-cadmium efflux system protein
VDGVEAHHGHSHGADRGVQARALQWALVANAVLLAAEVVGGLAFHSLALLADAAHLLSDVAALAVALVAHRLLARPATDRHSYGLQRAEVLAAQANGAALLAVSAWIVYVAVQRIGDAPNVDGGGLVAVALVGLVVNVVSAVVLARVSGASLNLRGAVTHLVADALGSVGAVVAGVAVLAWDASWVDPAVSIAIAVLVVWSAWRLLRDAAHVLLEGTPRGLSPAEVEAVLRADADVEAVHHLHLWNLASDVPALSAHVVLSGERTLHDAQASGDRLKVLLWSTFGIEHATLELECHPCDGPPAVHDPSSSSSSSRARA